jgi:hypothetical protein
VAESSALLNDDFCMTSQNVDSDKAMKRGNEALNAPLFQFFKKHLTLHRFITTFFTQR